MSFILEFGENVLIDRVIESIALAKGIDRLFPLTTFNLDPETHAIVLHSTLYDTSSGATRICSISYSQPIIPLFTQDRQADRVNVEGLPDEVVRILPGYQDGTHSTSREL